MAGRVVGHGLRSTVRELGDGRVVKIPHAETPSHWLRDEWRHLVVAERSGAPCPRSAQLVEVDAVPALAYEFVPGGTMWDALRVEPGRAEAFGEMLADVQFRVFRLPPSFALPSQRDRLRAKLRIASTRYGLDVEKATSFVLDHEGPVGFCHGDVHPQNVVLGPTEPVLLDWFDASRGLLVAEVARTSVLLQDLLVSGVGPGSDAGAAHAVHQAYVEAAGVGEDVRCFRRWECVQRVARLAEGFGEDSVPLVREQLSSF